MVVIGYDARHRSHRFAIDAARVLVARGIPATVLPRPMPTPVLAFAVKHLDASAGVMVTASHNPRSDNGCKVYWRGGQQLAAPIDTEIGRIIDRTAPLAESDLASDDDIGIETAGDELVEEYLDAVAGLLSPGGPRSVRMAYTPLHGVGAETFLRALSRAGFDPPAVVAEQAEPDPDFVNRPVSQPRGDRCCRSAAGAGRTHGRGCGPGPRPRCRPPGGGGARGRALAAADRRRDWLPAGRAPASPGRTRRRARTGHRPAQAGDQHGGVVAPAAAHRGRSRRRLGRDAHRLQVDPGGPLAAGRQPRPGAGLRGSARLRGGRGGQGQGRHRRGAGDGRTRRRPQARGTDLGRPPGRPSSPPRRARHRAALGPLRVGHRQPAADEDGHGRAARRSTDGVGGSRGDRGARPRRGRLAPAARGRCGAGAVRDRGQGDCQTQRDRAEDEALRRGGRGVWATATAPAAAHGCAQPGPRPERGSRRCWTRLSGMWPIPSGTDAAALWPRPPAPERATPGRAMPRPA